MGLIDFILNLAGLLLWLNWRSLRFDPLVRTSASDLIATLRRAEPRRLRGWQLLAALGGLLAVRALVYQQIGSDVSWTPKLNLFVVVLPFPVNARGWSGLGVLGLYSVLSFAWFLANAYFWLLFLTLVNGRSAEGDPIQRLVRLHLGRLGRWPRPVQLLLPIMLVAVLWMLLHPLLRNAGITIRVHSRWHLLGQGLLTGAGMYFSLKYLIPFILLAHLVVSYVYLGSSPLWDFLTLTARNLLAPLRWLPLRVGKCDFAPVVGAALVLLLLQILPDFVHALLAKNRLTLWPN